MPKQAKKENKQPKLILKRKLVVDVDMANVQTGQVYVNIHFDPPMPSEEQVKKLTNPEQSVLMAQLEIAGLIKSRLQQKSSLITKPGEK